MAGTATYPHTHTWRSWRKSWLLGYQDAAGTPDDEIVERRFANEEAALAWADAHYVVPRWLEEQDQLFGDNARLLWTFFERHEI